MHPTSTTLGNKQESIAILDAAVVIKDSIRALRIMAVRAAFLLKSKGDIYSHP